MNPDCICICIFRVSFVPRYMLLRVCFSLQPVSNSLSFTWTCADTSTGYNDTSVVRLVVAISLYGVSVCIVAHHGRHNRLHVQSVENCYALFQSLVTTAGLCHFFRVEV